MAVGTYYSGISLNLLRQHRTALSRERDAAGRATWTASVVGMPGYRATGSTRVEALERVRETLSKSRAKEERWERKRPGR